MIGTKVTILEKGEISITSKDVERYDLDCDSLMREIGKIIAKDIAVPSKEGYFFVFFPFGGESIRDLIERENKFPLVGSLFTIVYDKDLEFVFYKKEEQQILKDMRYMIFAY